VVEVVLDVVGRATAEAYRRSRSLASAFITIQS
jgi:hypothetical protein